MNIPDKSVEAAAKAAYDDAFMAHAPDYLPRYDEEDAVVKDSWREVARVSLEAAAPFIAAQALRDYADVVADGRVSFRDSEARGLRERAKWLEAGA